ncbi:MAG: phosphoribosylanthranilate isomerase [Thermoleophilia bacterium]
MPPEAEGPVRVKICGLTVPEEARDSARAGAWAIGVVFAPESSRRVDMDTARRVLDAVPPGVARVGVFVDATDDELRRAAACGLTHVQIHGAAADVARARAATGLEVILGVPFDGPEAALRADDGDADLVLFDAAVPGRHGGTGRTLDWDVLAAHRPRRPLGLAGSHAGQRGGRRHRHGIPCWWMSRAGWSWRRAARTLELVRAFIRAAHGRDPRAVRPVRWPLRARDGHRRN